MNVVWFLFMQPFTGYILAACMTVEHNYLNRLDVEPDGTKTSPNIAKMIRFISIECRPTNSKCKKRVLLKKHRLKYLGTKQKSILELRVIAT